MSTQSQNTDRVATALSAALAKGLTPDEIAAITLHITAPALHALRQRITDDQSALIPSMDRLSALTQVMGAETKQAAELVYQAAQSLEQAAGRVIAVLMAISSAQKSA